MIIPIRCFTCGKLIGDKWEEFTLRIQNGENPAKILDDLGFTRICCRRMFLSHVNLLEQFSVHTSRLRR
ncbi:MAG: DNA-directed RNA polymerase subunit N [Candidatus Methanomethylicia archaeon]